ncbi:MAG: glycosyltransferase family 39 protein [Armatimonadota bacterium]|nr:glycosyltransferase family 39 protein [Armatimonadota bacterium]
MVRRFSPFFAILITAVALALRLYGLKWGLPNMDHYFSYHPDETTILEAAQRIDFFSGQIDPGFYNYGSLYIYLVYIAIFMGMGWGLIVLGKRDPELIVRGYAQMYLAGRVVALLMGVATVLLVYYVGRRMYGRRTGLIAAVFMAILPIHVMHSHFLAVDVPATFFVTCSLLFASRIPEEKSRTRYYLLSGLFAGFSAATKYNAGLVVLAPIVAHLSKGGSFFRRLMSLNLLLVIIGLAAGFLIGCPGAVLNSESFLRGFLYEAHHVQTGHGLLFAETGSGFIYHLIHSLLPGMGLPIMVLALAGVIYAIRKWTPQDAMLIAFLVPYYVLIGVAQVRFARYTMPILPPLVLLGARIPGKLMERFEDERGFARGVARVVTGALTGLIVLYTLFYSISLDGVMAREDNRDAALTWIRKNIPPGSSIAMPTIPWFYTPPLDPRFGYGSARARFEAAQSIAEYGIITDESKEWNWRLLSEMEPEFVILSEFEYEDRLRIGDQAAIDYFAVLDKKYRLVRQFDSPPSIFGKKFPLLVELPHDMSYANPTIKIYARNDIVLSNG